MSRKPPVHILPVMENHTFMPVLFPYFLIMQLFRFCPSIFYYPSDKLQIYFFNTAVSGILPHGPSLPIPAETESGPDKVPDSHRYLPEFLQAWIYLPHYIQSPLFSSFSSNTFLTILILPICGKLREWYNGLSPHRLF